MSRKGKTEGLSYNPPSMLEAQKLAARRGFSRLFDGLSFRVGAGEALVVTGANGSGKTTLLRTLAGLTAPETGEIRWHGRPVGTFDPELRAAVAFSGHLPALKDGLTAEENLARSSRSKDRRRRATRSSKRSTASP
jgi:heme exporter protein A